MKLDTADQIGRVADALFAQAKALRDSAKSSATQVEVSKAMLITQIETMQASKRLEASLMQSLMGSGQPMPPPPGGGSRHS